MTPLPWETTALEPNRSRCTGSTIVMVFADTARVLSYKRKHNLHTLNKRGRGREREKGAHFFSKDKVRRRKFWVLVDDIDRGLVNEGDLAISSQHFPFLLMEADVRVQPNAE